MEKVIVCILFFAFNFGFTQSKNKPVLIHQVYFWLNKDLSASDVAKFESEVKSLLKIKYVRYGNIGKPANTTKRSVIDDSYSIALVLHFDDVKAHDLYQIDPIHEKFLKNCTALWSKVIVYDASCNP